MEEQTYTLKEILQYAYRLRASIGPVDPTTIPEAMFLANEKEIRAAGGSRKIPGWRRKQIRESLKEVFPESYYYAVESGNLPRLDNVSVRMERA